MKVISVKDINARNVYKKVHEVCKFGRAMEQSKKKWRTVGAVTSVRRLLRIVRILYTLGKLRRRRKMVSTWTRRKVK